jgi:5S rRNA maturation endonuclease (ribonuclease M5)
MRVLRVDKYIIDAPIIKILQRLRTELVNGKLREIKYGKDDIVVTCPHHSEGRERKAACNIYIGENEDIPYGFARCFACDFKTDFVGFIAECFDSSKDFAKNWLISNYGEESEDYIFLGDDIEINTKKKPKILDESVLEQFQPWTPYLQKRKLNRTICEKLKVKYDSKNRQVVFPVYDINSNLKMLARRSIDTKFFYLDREQDKEVYCLNIIQKNNVKKCILTEGPIDALTGWSFGYPTIATLGNVSDYQIDQINKSCLNTIYIATDNDTTGNKIRQHIKNKLNKRIIVFDINIPKPYKDLNDLDYETFLKCLENAN